MFLDRREFMAAVAAGGSVLALPRLGFADEAGKSTTGKTIVLLHLNGGNDGLNTVIPYKDSNYRRLRPALAIDRGQVRKISDDLGLHPALQGLETQFKKDRLAIVNGVGYPNHNYSHFRSTEIWFTAEPDKTPTYGWMGRALDTRPSEKPLRAVALQKEQPLSLASGSPGVVTMTDFSKFRVPSNLQGVAKLYGDYAAMDGARKDVGDAGAEAIRVAKRIARLKPAGGPFYGRIGQDVRKVIALLQADLGIECIQFSMGGYDTHANQSGSHNQLLAQLGNNLNAYQDELERLGLADRVVTVVFSEFGRRVTENLSGGTDHGSAGPVFVLGKGINAGFHGAYPSLEDLDRENFKYTTDFRRIYAALLQNAFDQDPKPVVGSFEPLELFA